MSYELQVIKLQINDKPFPPRLGLSSAPSAQRKHDNLSIPGDYNYGILQ